MFRIFSKIYRTVCPKTRHFTWFTGQNAVAKKEGYTHFKNDFGTDWTGFALIGTIPVSLAAYYLWNLDRAPFTGRVRMISISQQREQALGESAFRSLLQQHVVLAENHPSTLLVKRVGHNIANASGLHNLQWEFKVVASPVVNAACLPGGKVVVFSGLLELFGHREEALAVILAHEAAHILARHSAEKLGFTQLLVWGEFAVNLIFKAHFFTDWITTLFGTLPYSRKLESEADHIGLMLLARTCRYPLSAAPVVMEILGRAAAAKSGHSGPDFFSTHPSDDRRAEALRELLPRARAEREAHCAHHPPDEFWLRAGVSEAAGGRG